MILVTGVSRMYKIYNLYINNNMCLNLVMCRYTDLFVGLLCSFMYKPGQQIKIYYCTMCIMRGIVLM